MVTDRSHAPLVLTAREVAIVVARLERQPCTARRVRYLLADGLSVDGATCGRTRLFTASDVALMRLAVRLEALGLSAWVARVVLAYGADDLRAVWRRGSADALIVRGVMGSIEPTTAPKVPDAAAIVPLRSVWVGLESAMRATRAAAPTVWQWKPVSPANMQVAR